MAAAIRTCDPGGGVEAEAHETAAHAPGRLRDAWLERTADPALRRRVTAMANAGLASLQQLPAATLVETAARYGAPLTAELAEELAAHFAAKRNAVLTYNR